MLKELAAAFPDLNADLSAEQILAQCERWTPVNTRIEAAIEAHRQAFSRYYQHERLDLSARETSMFALRAVILARLETRDDLRAASDYLAGLPEVAWPDMPELSADEYREATLGGISRLLTWMAAN